MYRFMSHVIHNHVIHNYFVLIDPHLEVQWRKSMTNYADWFVDPLLQVYNNCSFGKINLIPIKTPRR